MYKSMYIYIHIYIYILNYILHYILIHMQYMTQNIDTTYLKKETLLGDN